MHRMTRIRRTIIALLASLALIVGLAACDNHQGNAQQSESKSQQNGYDRLVAKDPAHQMDVSPTRNTINKWIDTWGKDPNKLSYVYLQNASGDLLGYYVFKGLPVSYCTSLTPTYKIIDDDNGGNLSVPAPSVDGVYYGSSGACDTYYGFDADTGSYVEYTAGLGINVLVYDKPLAQHPNVENLAPHSK